MSKRKNRTPNPAVRKWLHDTHGTIRAGKGRSPHESANWSRSWLITSGGAIESKKRRH